MHDATQTQRAMRRHPQAKASTQLYASKHTKVSTQNWEHVISVQPGKLQQSQHPARVGTQDCCCTPSPPAVAACSCGVGLPCWQQYMSAQQTAHICSTFFAGSVNEMLVKTTHTVIGVASVCVATHTGTPAISSPSSCRGVVQPQTVNCADHHLVSHSPGQTRRLCVHRRTLNMHVKAPARQ